MDIIYQILLFFVGQLLAAAAIWGGIRGDIRAIHRREEALQAQLTEQRIRMDRHLETTGLHMKVPD